MPRPYIQDIIEANALAREAVKFASTGLTIHPILLQYLGVGTVTDASWANAKADPEQQATDFWEEREYRWIRRHLQPHDVSYFILLRFLEVLMYMNFETFASPLRTERSPGHME